MADLDSQESDELIGLAQLSKIEAVETVHCTSPVNDVVFGPQLPGPLQGPQLPGPLSVVNRDTVDVKAQRGVCGLRNLGNTCFMNAGLQCVLSNPIFMQHFFDTIKDDSEQKITIMDQFVRILRKVWSGHYSSIYPDEFKKILGWLYPQFNDFRQHDCQEFLALLLDHFHEELNSVNQSKTATPLAIDQSEEETQQTADNHSVIDQSGNSQNSASKNMTPAILITEDSNLSANSPISDNSDFSSIEGGQSLRMEPLPEQMRSFGTQSENSMENSRSASNSPCEQSMKLKCTPDELANNKKDPLSPVKPDKNIMSNNAPRGIHLSGIEEFYMKETKTKNVNMLVDDISDEEQIKTDSDKFTKQDNTSRNLEDVDIEVAEITEELDVKGETSKRFKEVNLLANQRDKIVGDCYLKKSLSQSFGSNDACMSYNNIKRLKIDKTENVSNIEKLNLTKGMSYEEKENNLKGNTLLQNMETPMHGAHTLQFKKNEMSSGDHENIRNPNQYGESMDIEMESPDTGDHILCTQGPTTDDIIDAKKAWDKYLESNKSAIVDKFQGQFKSTVVCLECRYVSVTYEPFMYLSVPLPHAMERQIVVTFVPCDQKQPMKYLVTLHKFDKVLQLRQQIAQLIGDETGDLKIAEVFENHIARILEDSTMLRYVNDYNRSIYAFEMTPYHLPDDDITKLDDITTQNDDITNSDKYGGSSSLMSSSCNNLMNNAPDGEKHEKANDFDVIDNITEASLNQINDTKGNENYPPIGTFDVDDMQQGSPNAEWTDTSVNIDIDDLNGRWGDVDAPQPDITGTSHWQQNAEFSSRSDVADWLLCSEGDDQVLPTMEMESDEKHESKTQSEAATGIQNEAIVTSQWNSCAICLEELQDSELLVHTVCSGKLCNSCLEMSFKHYGEAAFNCPVCLSPVHPAEDFVTLSSVENFKPKTRLLSVPLVFRNDYEDEAGKTKVRLVGHPNILYLPSTIKGELLYELVDPLMLIDCKYQLLLTDGQGTHCSRCSFTVHCAGCSIDRDSEDITLAPNDHLAIKINTISSAQMSFLNETLKHTSMEEERSKDPLTLYDCFKAFTQSEILDEGNPWYCPKCESNQCANKTMSVWTYPEYLVVYLKRFVFHELSSAKIDNAVVFPIEDLDLSPYISGPKISELTYDLHACVCHFGGANAGHYTAYTKHPLLDEWFYYNDEQTIKQVPQETDHSNAYILFYKNQGSKVQFKLPESTPPPQESSIDTTATTYQPIDQETISKILSELNQNLTTQTESSGEEIETPGKKTDINLPNFDFYS